MGTDLGEVLRAGLGQTDQLTTGLGKTIEKTDCSIPISKTGQGSQPIVESDSEQIEEREEKDPHHVDEMPVQSDDFHSVGSVAAR